MSLDATRQKLDWLLGLKGIRVHRLQEVMKKRDWPASDLETKQRDIEMIDVLIEDYRRVQARYLERENAA